jgi:hypothetical protein
MNKELIEKVTALREYLASLAKITDVKKLADLVEQNAPMVQSTYDELLPYLTAEQVSRHIFATALNSAAAQYYQTGKEDSFIFGVTKLIPLVIADLDDLAANFKKTQPRE